MNFAIALLTNALTSTLPMTVSIAGILVELDNQSAPTTVEVFATLVRDNAFVNADATGDSHQLRIFPTKEPVLSSEKRADLEKEASNKEACKRNGVALEDGVLVIARENSTPNSKAVCFGRVVEGNDALERIFDGLKSRSRTQIMAIRFIEPDIPSSDASPLIKSYYAQRNKLKPFFSLEWENSRARAAEKELEVELRKALGRPPFATDGLESGISTELSNSLHGNDCFDVINYWCSSSSRLSWCNKDIAPNFSVSFSDARLPNGARPFLANINGAAAMFCSEGQIDHLATIKSNRGKFDEAQAILTRWGGNCTDKVEAFLTVVGKTGTFITAAKIDIDSQPKFDECILDKCIPDANCLQKVVDRDPQIAKKLERSADSLLRFLEGS